jgi:predicted nucleic acid-binding protein
VVTIGEIRRGIDSVLRRDAVSAAALNRWLRDLVEGFDERILPVDRAIAEEWGRLNVPDPLPVIDGLLAATAKVRALTLVTRNTRHVAGTGVSYINPFAAPP